MKKHLVVFLADEGSHCLSASHCSCLPIIPDGAPEKKQLLLLLERQQFPLQQESLQQQRGMTPQLSIHPNFLPPAPRGAVHEGPQLKLLPTAIASPSPDRDCSERGGPGGPAHQRSKPLSRPLAHPPPPQEEGNTFTMPLPHVDTEKQKEIESSSNKASSCRLLLGFSGEVERVCFEKEDSTTIEEENDARNKDSKYGNKTQ